MKLNSKIFDNSINFIKRRIAELVGFLLVIVSGLFIFSLSKYSPESPSFILNADQLNLTDYSGSLSNAVSDIFLQSFGLISFFIGINILFWGVNLIVNKKINKIINKLFYTVLYISCGCLLVYIVNNNSFWLIYHGNAGFVGEKGFNLVYKYLPLIEKDFSKIALIILFLLFFILSSGINIKKIFPYFSSLFKSFFKKKASEEKIEESDHHYDLNKGKDETNFYKQQSFSFQKVDEKKSGNYKLPSIGLLTKKIKYH